MNYKLLEKHPLLRQEVIQLVEILSATSPRKTHTFMTNGLSQLF